MPCICNLTIPEPSLLYLALIPQQTIFLCFIILGPGTRQLETTPYSPKSTGLNKKSLLRCWFCPALPFLQKSQWSLWPKLPPCCSILPPDSNLVLPLWPCVACGDPFSRTCEYNKLLFSWASCLLLWPHLIDHHIKEHRTFSHTVMPYYWQYYFTFGILFLAFLLPREAENFQNY